MKLKKLEIVGFKSFVDKAAIEFPPGISAVVGPNGCGKSNVIDALRWVMGEQSVKQLRGKSMEDVIFAGTNGRLQMNMAEVTLTLMNDNGSAPQELKDFSEIMLTRRLYRSGESAYLLNKQPCRLKDIHNVFLGSGLGARSFSIIQQGNIGAIIDAGPEERRIFIEEAAGIIRYKNRKNEALRKVEATNQNLLRVQDILVEVKRQMDGLKRQVKKAERYKKYQEKIKRYDVRLALCQHAAYTLQIEESNRLIETLKDSDLQQSARLKRLDAAVEEIKLKRTRKDEEIAQQKSRQFELQRAIDRTENDLTHLREDVENLAGEVDRIGTVRNQLEAKTAGIASELVQVENETLSARQELDRVRLDLQNEKSASAEISSRLSVLNEAVEAAKNHLMKCVAEEAKYKNTYQNASVNKENLQRRLKRIREEEAQAVKRVQSLEASEAEANESLKSAREKIEGLKARIETLQKALREKNESLSARIRQVQKMELEGKELRSRHSTLKRMQDNYEWYKEGVKSIMKNRAGTEGSEQQTGGIIGLVADIVEPDPSFATAAEAVLGEALQYILVSDQDTGVRSIRYLQSTASGRSGFIPLSSLKAPDPEKGDPSNRLLNHIAVKPGFEKTADTLLGHVRVAENLEEALEIWNRNGVRQTVVTKDGDMVGTQGILIGGTAQDGSGILAKKQELKELKERVEILDKDLEAARKVQTGLEAEAKSAEIDLQKMLEQKQDAVLDETAAEKELYKVSEDLKFARRHLDISRLEGHQLSGEASDLEGEIEKYHRAIAEIEKEVKAAQARVTETSDQIRTVSGKMDEYSQRIVDFKLKLAALNAKLENSSANRNRLKSYHQDSLKRLEEYAEEISQKKQKRALLKEKIVEFEQALSARYEVLKHLEEAIEGNRKDYEAIDAVLHENDSELNQIQSLRQEVLDKIRVLELEQSQIKLKRENIVDQMENRYQTSFSLLQQEAGPAAESTDMTVEQMEEEIADLRNKISLIGDVNLGAIGEFEQLKERFDFLTRQHDDLVGAIEDLHKVIRKINRITRERFMETFEQVNEKLKVVFPSLFEGGTAQLTLTEPDNPLETGVEFLIQPPGKKLTRMSLLSGGEKALSAIAFIFSIFLIKPTSFCLLDEIDAPLDDANVYRFNNLLQLIGEKSQIVMITHNKKTMEFADTLFGITMEQKGVSKVVSVNLKKSE
jgi:chromosome segregation protein